MFRFLSFFFVYFSFISFSFGQKFIATLDKNQVAVGEPFVLTYQLEGMGGSQFRAPAFNDEELEVIGGPNLTNKIAIVNGQMARATEISLVITAKKNGKFSIPSATINANGKSIPSNPVVVNVTGMARTSPQSPNIPAPQNPSQSPQDADNQTTERLKDNIILRAEPSKKTVYVGEPVLVSYKLYKRERMAPGTRMSMPSFEGFWMEEVGTKNVGTMANLNGKPYECFEMRKLMLFPQKSGQLTIPELDVQTEVYLKNNPFDFQMPSLDDVLSGRWQGGGMSSVPYVAKSAPIILEVKPLPEAGKPNNFSGLVGEFALATELSNKNVKTDEPIHLKVIISGKGNMKMVDAPKLNLPEGWEAYEPEKEEKINMNEEGQEGSISYDYTLVSSKTGDFELPPVKLAFFSLEKEQYQELQSPAFKVSVAQGIVSKSDPTDMANEAQNNAHSTSFDWKKYLLAFLIFVGMLVVGYRIRKKVNYLAQLFPKKQSQSISVKETKKQSAKPIAEPKEAVQEQAKLALPSIDASHFYEDCIAFLKQEMGQKLALPPHYLLQDIGAFFQKHNLTKSVFDNYKNLIETCETALYAPHTPTIERQTLLTNILAWRKNLSEMPVNIPNLVGIEDEWHFSKE